jgi:hypothetical protein
MFFWLGRWRIAAVLCVSLVVVLFVITLSHDPIASRVKSIQAAGEPAYWKDLAPEPIPDDQNAELLMRKAAPGVARINAVQFADTATSAEIARRNAMTLTKQDLITLEQAFTTDAESLKHLTAAAKLPDAQFPLNYDESPLFSTLPVVESISHYRAAARCLWIRAYSLARVGEGHEAIQLCEDVYRLAHHCAQLPDSTSWMSAHAIDDWNSKVVSEILACNDVSAIDLEPLVALLDRQPDIERFRRTLLVDRAREITMSGIYEHFYERPFVLRRRAQLIDAYSNQLRFAQIAYAQYRRENQILRTLPKWMPGGTWIQDPNFADALRCILERSQARKQCLRVWIQFRKSNPGLDARVEDMTPEMLGEDPFTSEPLHVRHAPEGTIIYSVGENQIDDGGSLTDIRDIGIGPLRIEPPPPLE